MLRQQISHMTPIQLLYEYFFQGLFFIILFPYKVVHRLLMWYVVLRVMFDLRKTWYHKLKDRVQAIQLNGEEKMMDDRFRKEVFEIAYDHRTQVSFRMFKKKKWFKWIFSIVVYLIIIYKLFLADLPQVQSLISSIRS